MVAHLLPKQRVAGSNPVSRSITDQEAIKCFWIDEKPPVLTTCLGWLEHRGFVVE